jgi:DNA polymerase III subunit delta'
VAYSEDQAFELISSAFKRGRLGHAFLVIGSEECGAHRLASRMVDLVNADHNEPVSLGFDLFGEAPVQAHQEPKPLDELEGELVRVLRPEKKSRIISVPAMRKFEKSLYISAPKDKWNIGIVEPADRLNDSSANAFLKTLEEPPNRTLLILISQYPERLLPTILSRCLNIHLVGTKQKKTSTAELEVLQSIATHCKNGLNSDIQALKMKSAFANTLSERRIFIEASNDQALKDEEAAYAKTTDGSWLKERQEYYKSRTESEYLLERTLLIDTLVSWFGDIVRQKCQYPYFDYPQIAKLTSRLAESIPLNDLLNRMQALESLRDALTTNAEEKLTLEVGFLRAFG